MFFILSKTLYFIGLPFSWLCFLLLFMFFTKNALYKRRAMRLVLLLFFVFTNPFLVNEAFLAWEIAPTAFKNVKKYDVALVLTGVTQDYKSPKDRIYFEKGADRILHAIRLYKEKKVRKILISGAEYDLLGQKLNAERHLASIFLMAGIPSEDIIREDKSKNTHENAIFSAKILQKEFPKQKYILISSAFHLRRAKACFAKAGIEADTFSTDFYSTDITAVIIPSEKAFEKWHILFKEWIGFAVYAFRGYL